MAEQRNESSVQSISRAFDILEALSLERKGLRLTELSEQLELHKSTVYRILKSLIDRGYVEKSDKYYRLGLGFIMLSSHLLNSIELKTEAEPYLRQLSDLTGQTVFLAVREETEVVYIDKVEQFNSLRRYSIIGKRIPIYCTSLGRSLLFDEDEESLDNLLNIIEIKKVTRKTETDPIRLQHKIRRMKKRGWSEDIEEHQSGVRCVGAPVYDYRNKIIAAISTAWNVSKTEADPDFIGRAVKQTAEEISRRLGKI